MSLLFRHPPFECSVALYANGLLVPCVWLVTPLDLRVGKCATRQLHIVTDWLDGLALAKRSLENLRHSDIDKNRKSRCVARTVWEKRQLRNCRDLTLPIRCRCIGEYHAKGLIRLHVLCIPMISYLSRRRCAISYLKLLKMV